MQRDEAEEQYRFASLRWRICQGRGKGGAFSSVERMAQAKLANSAAEPVTKASLNLVEEILMGTNIGTFVSTSITPSLSRSWSRSPPSKRFMAAAALSHRGPQWWMILSSGVSSMYDYCVTLEGLDINRGVKLDNISSMEIGLHFFTFVSDVPLT